MIRYTKGWFGINLIFRIAGTSWPYGVVPGAISCAISIVLAYWKEADSTIRDRPEFIDHPYGFQLFAYLLGVVIVFRTNFAYQRYWEAMGALQGMAAKWLDGACMGIVFDAGGANNLPLLHGALDAQSEGPHPQTKDKGGPVHNVFFADICHLCSLLHALALMHLRGDTNLNNLASAEIDMGGSFKMSFHPGSGDSPSAKTVLGIPNFDEKYIQQVFVEQRLFVLGGLSKAESEALTCDCNGRARSTVSRVAMVEGWFMRRLIARQKFEQGESAATSPPILSRLYQVISDGTLWFSHASKIAETPFPFPYHNLISILLWSYTLLAPLLMNSILMEDGLRAVMSFSAVFVYHALNNIGDNLEDPYQPYDPNELPLPDIQDLLNKKLLAFGIVPDAYDISIGSEMPVQYDKDDAVPKENGATSASSLPSLPSGNLKLNGITSRVSGNGDGPAEVIGKSTSEVPSTSASQSVLVDRFSSQTLRESLPPGQKQTMSI